MANVVVQLGNAAPQISSNESLEVWRDIDTTSTRNFNYKQVEEPSMAEYVKWLKTEHKVDVDESQLGQLSSFLVEGQDLDNPTSAISAIAVVVKSGYAELYDLYQKYMQPYRWRIAKLVNVDSVKNSLRNIFTWIPGERIINPQFGNRLRQFLYEGITEANTEQVIAEIKKCVSEFEPRVSIVKIVNASTVDDTENNTVHLEIIYTIPSLSPEQFNYSYYYKRGK